MESGDWPHIIRPECKGHNPLSHHAGPRLNFLNIIGRKHKLCKEKDDDKVGLSSKTHSGKPDWLKIVGVWKVYIKQLSARWFKTLSQMHFT